LCWIIQLTARWLMTSAARAVTWLSAKDVEGNGLGPIWDTTRSSGRIARLLAQIRPQDLPTPSDSDIRPVVSNVFYIWVRTEYGFLTTSKPMHTQISFFIFHFGLGRITCFEGGGPPPRPPRIPAGAGGPRGGGGAPHADPARHAKIC
jgi:hypothetical protein